MKIPFSKVDCSGNEIAYVTEVLKSGWLTTGAKAQALEQRFGEFLNVRFSCAVNSGTAALHLALEALGVGPGDRVVVPTMTFTATAEVVRYLGADPVFTDVEYGTCLMTPEILTNVVKRNQGVKVVLVVHYGGQAAEMYRHGGKGIVDICHEKGIRIVEDAAHAFPARQDGHVIGGVGDATCFSFYANKSITTGEGGMLTTNDEAIARRVQTMRLHGIDRDIWNRFNSEQPSWEYDVVAAGYKYNMSDVNAAIGLAQLEKAEEFRRQRERCARFYYENLGDIEDLDLPVVRVDFSDHAWHLYPIILRGSSRTSRNEFIERMFDAGIGVSVHYKPLHRMSYYRGHYDLSPNDFPEAERIWNGCVSLPVYPGLSDSDLRYICETVRSIFRVST
jgi:dTDP-4-amino-4,6-dideoxygalactose transaminase